MTHTLKELADIGARAAFTAQMAADQTCATRMDSADTRDEPARQAFAQAVRDAVLADLVTKSDSLPTFDLHGKTWTRHTLGDPMPCGENEEVHVLMGMDAESDRMFGDEALPACNWEWWDDEEHERSNIIGWRYADKPTIKTIPLDISDIRATDEFRPCGEAYQLCTLRHADEEAASLFYCGGSQHLTYKELAANYLRRQHGSNEWKPCTKEISANQQ